ncbi:MAG: hypothetical protein R3F49_07540 [Planctomycetota bacterium]
MKSAVLLAVSTLAITVGVTTKVTHHVLADSKPAPAAVSGKDPRANPEGVALVAALDRDAPKTEPKKPTGSQAMDDSALEIGTQYCTSVRNSVGMIANLSIFGSPVAAANSVALHVTGLPEGAYGVFLTSRYPGFVYAPLNSSGNICLRRDVGRFTAGGQVKRSGLLGTLTLDTTLGEWSNQAIPRTAATYAAMAGTRSHFQLWYRDNEQGVPTSNFSDAEYVDWQ